MWLKVTLFESILGGLRLGNPIQMSNEKNLGCLFDIRDYTTQFYGDHNKPS